MMDNKSFIIVYMEPLPYANIGNSCYLNSLIQCLLSLKIFRSICAGSANPLLQSIIRARGNLIEVAKLMPWYRSGSQECVHESLTMLLDNCDIRNFNHRKCIVRRCEKCLNRNMLPEDTGNIILIDGNLDGNSMTLVVDDGGECHCGGNIKVHYILTKINDVLVISFNKFREKYLAEYPIQINILLKGNIRAQYNLKAQLEHVGSMQGGHYIARVLRDKWYLANDSQISEIPAPTMNQNVFILFYELETVSKL